MNPVWYTKYRPKTIEDYVFNDEKLKSQVQKWIENGSTPHLLLTGAPGCGKTSLARLLVEQLGIEETDIKKISATIFTKKGDVEELEPFLNSGSWGGKGRYIILDEGDKMPPKIQDMLRNIIGEEDEDYRFIITGNYTHKFTPAFKSRLTHIQFKEMPKDSFIDRLFTIMEQESVMPKSEEDFMKLVDATYPDLRSAIDMLEADTIDGTYTFKDSGEEIADWAVDSVALMQAGKFRECRELVVKSLSLEEYDTFFTFLYENLELIMEFNGEVDYNKVDAGIIAIKNAAAEDSLIANREINLAALMIRLGKIYNG